MIAAGTVNDVRLYRDLVASGIHDYLLKPFTRRPAARHLRARADDPVGPRGETQADKPHVMAAVDRRPRRRRRIDDRHLACVAVRREGAPFDRACSTSTFISAPVRWHSTSSLAAALPTRSKTQAASTVCSSSGPWFAPTSVCRFCRPKRRSISRWSPTARPSSSSRKKCATRSNRRFSTCHDTC